MTVNSDAPTQTAARANHRRVRYYHDSAIDDGPEIGITLGSEEHVMSVEDALSLANRIILTAVDKETRYAE